MTKSPKFLFVLLGTVLLLGLSEAAKSSSSKSSKASSSLSKQRVKKAAAKKEAKKVVSSKVYQPVSKQQALRQISAKLKSVSKTQPVSVFPSQQTDSQLKKLSADELKQLKTLYTKMSTIALTITVFFLFFFLFFFFIYHFFYSIIFKMLHIFLESHSHPHQKSLDKNDRWENCTRPLE